jgi:hypothetical protein
MQSFLLLLLLMLLLLLLMLLLLLETTTTTTVLRSTKSSRPCRRDFGVHVDTAAIFSWQFCICSYTSVCVYVAVV